MADTEKRARASSKDSTEIVHSETGASSDDHTEGRTSASRDPTLAEISEANKVRPFVVDDRLQLILIVSCVFLTE